MNRTINTQKLASMGLSKINKACLIHIKSMAKAVKEQNKTKIQAIKVVGLQCLKVRREFILKTVVEL